jgi:hypothetical protein
MSGETNYLRLGEGRGTDFLFVSLSGAWSTGHFSLSINLVLGQLLISLCLSIWCLVNWPFLFVSLSGAWSTDHFSLSLYLVLGQLTISLCLSIWCLVN